MQEISATQLGAVREARCQARRKRQSLNRIKAKVNGKEITASKLLKNAALKRPTTLDEAIAGLKCMATHVELIRKIITDEQIILDQRRHQRNMKVCIILCWLS